MNPGYVPWQAQVPKIRCQVRKKGFPFKAQNQAKLENTAYNTASVWVCRHCHLGKSGPGVPEVEERRAGVARRSGRRPEATACEASASLYLFNHVC